MAILQVEEQASDGTRETITGRSIVLGVLSAGGIALYGNAGEMVLHVGSLVKSNFPVSLILAFTIWVVVNMVIARIMPKAVLSSTELMTIFGMTWIGGMMPGVGWMGYLIGALPAPHFFATPENRWGELFLDELPRWAFPEPSPEIMDRFYFGLHVGEELPWAGWVMPVWWWFSACIAMTGVAFCVTAIFHRQWADAERLTYPLVNFPVDMTEGFKEGRSIPDLFKKPVFWLGFGWTAGIICWNIITFWYPQVPRITLFDSINTKAMMVARGFPPVYLRVLPLVIGLGYLCSLELLFSFWFFGLLAVVKVGMMNRTGFTVGLSGQPSTGSEIINLESHGAMTILVVWSLWMARRHLVYVWQCAWKGGDEREGPLSYRIAVLGLVVCSTYVCAFFMSMGLSFSLALGQMLMMFIAYFTVAKYMAATGFGYLVPVGGKGGWWLNTVMGTATMDTKNLVGLGLLNSSTFYGAGRLQTIQMLPHHLKAMDHVKDRRGWVSGTVFLAFSVAFVVSAATIIYFCYTESALFLRSWTLWEGPHGIFNGLATSIGEADRTVFDPQKLGIWLVGAGEAGLLALLRTWFPWWPLHPLGLAFQYTTGPRYYALSILMVWAAKLLIVHYGGPRMYEKAKPFFYGTVIGYCVGIGIAQVVDLIWFPGSGHGFHNY
ncbi:MAG: hypothetical protein O2954_05620 [bacterium]|nr:hypothetical protein [bacterium]